MSDTWEAFAVTYAKSDRRSSENFIGGDPHDMPMPLTYYVWVIRNGTRTVVIDTGFDQRGADLRGNRTITRPVAEGLEALGIDRAAVTDVVATHMHYDHIGNPGVLPNARYHLQDCEMAYATGRCMCHPFMNHAFEVEDVTRMVRRVYAGRVQFHDGDAALFPGVSLHHIGGHSPGLQCVRVKTKRGPVVIASDTTHHYAHIQEGRVFTTVDSVSGVLEGYERLKRLGGGLDRIVPGHDPLVEELYPAVPGIAGIVRLDETPAEIPTRIKQGQ